MAADTAQRRLSAIQIGAPWRGPAVLPDGTVESGDRAALVFLYSGIAGAVPTPRPEGVVAALTFDPDYTATLDFTDGPTVTLTFEE